MAPPAAAAAPTVASGMATHIQATEKVLVTALGKLKGSVNLTDSVDDIVRAIRTSKDMKRRFKMYSDVNLKAAVSEARKSRFDRAKRRKR